MNDDCNGAPSGEPEGGLVIEPRSAPGAEGATPIAHQPVQLPLGREMEEAPKSPIAPIASALAVVLETPPALRREAPNDTQTVDGAHTVAVLPYKRYVDACAHECRSGDRAGAARRAIDQLMLNLPSEHLRPAPIVDPVSGGATPGDTWIYGAATKVFAVHAALMPDRRVLCFGGSEHDKMWQRSMGVGPLEDTRPPIDTPLTYYMSKLRWVDRYELWSNDGASQILGGRVSGRNPMSQTGGPGFDAFCSGHAWAGDVGLLVAGGTDVYNPEPGGQRRDFHHGHYSGLRSASMFVPIFGRFGPMEEMHGEIDPQTGNELPLTMPPNDPWRSRLALQGGGRWYPGMVTLHDGRVLVVGGHPAEDDRSHLTRPAALGALSTLQPGVHDNLTIEVFDPRTFVWLNYGPTWANLLGTPREVPFDLGYARMHLLPDGRVLIVNAYTTHPTEDRAQCTTMIWDPFAYDGIPTSRAGMASPRGRPFEVVATLDVDVGFPTTCVLLPLRPPYDSWEVLLVGTGPDESRLLASRELGRGWQRIGYGFGIEPSSRIHAIATLLPDGTALVTGGIRRLRCPPGSVILADGRCSPTEYRDGQSPYDIDADLAAMQYFPERREWEPRARARVPRNYHSTALLLPDATVWTAGSNLDSVQGSDLSSTFRRVSGGAEPTHSVYSRPPRRVFRKDNFRDADYGPTDVPTVAFKEKRVEIYYPEYFRGMERRPTIVSVTPQRLEPGAAILIETDLDEATVRTLKVHAMRCGSCTHGFDADQRFVELEVHSVRGRYIFARTPDSTPRTVGVMPPGWWMLFLVTEDGVPSEATMVRVLMPPR